MPTHDRKAAISLDEARERAGFNAFPEPDEDTRLGGVGLEPEFFPIHHDSNGRPRGRLMLTEPGGAGVVDRRSRSG